MRFWTYGCALATLLTATPEASGDGAKAAPPPSVVMVVVDTVRADRVSAYGYERPTTPVFDAVAADGYLFDNAYAPSPWTRPSVASLFSGLYPQRHGVQMRRDKLPQEVPTLAALLRERGLQTVALTTNPHVTDTWGMTRGFDRVVEIMPDKDRFKAGNGAATVYKRLRRVISEVEGPYFLYIHLIDPHWPYEPPRVDLQRIGVRAQSPGASTRYDGEIHFADRYTGHMLRALEERGLMHDAIVVLTSDHGEEWYEHGSTGHGKTVYQEVVRVPLAMRLPARLRPTGKPTVGHRIAANVSLVDLMPTLARLAGAPVPDGLDGEDLTALLAGEPSEPRPLYFSVEKERASLAGVQLEMSKLIVDRESSNRRMYDLAADPFEKSPLPHGDGEAVAYLGSLLESFEWSARPGLHLELAGRAAGKDRRDLVVRLKTNGRFVNVERRSFERGDGFRLSDDGSFLRVEVALTSFWHRSPKHVWVQDRDELLFDVEPPDASIELSVRRDGERAATGILRFPVATTGLWPVKLTRQDLVDQGNPALVDRRRGGVYLYGQGARDVEKVEAVSQDVAAALRALGYVQ